MKTLIINGSPRKNGDTMTLINEMTKYLSGDFKLINTYYDQISPCLDCRYCWRNDGCAINDGMQEVYRLLHEVDNVILASPLYFSELTGQLLSFASRLQYFYVSRRIRQDPNFQIKKKNGVLILTGGGDLLTEPAMTTAGYLLGQMKVKSIGTVSSLKTNDIPAKDDLEALAKARALALRLNELNQPRLGE